MGARENSGTRKKEEELGSEICAKKSDDSSYERTVEEEALGRSA
jgi:hypothetical protein